jgi:hypothetical protein
MTQTPSTDDPGNVGSTDASNPFAGRDGNYAPSTSY